jgi:uroporphyrinogen-III synthase
MTERLKNITVAVTRDNHQAGHFIHLLQNEGACIFSFPVLKITEPENWDETDNTLEHLDDFEWIIFSSKNSVDYFMQRVNYHKLDIHDKKMAVVGEKTAFALKACHLEPTIQPTDFSASGLLKIMKNEHLRNSHILFPCSEIALSKIPDKLTEAGAKVKKLMVYRNVLNKSIDPEPFIKELYNKGIDCITFFSPSAVHNFVLLTGEENLKLVKRNDIAIAAIGKTTKNSITENGLVTHISPEKSTSESMSEAIINYYESK